MCEFSNLSEGQKGKRVLELLASGSLGKISCSADDRTRALLGRIAGELDTVEGEWEALGRWYVSGDCWRKLPLNAAALVKVGAAAALLDGAREWCALPATHTGNGRSRPSVPPGPGPRATVADLAAARAKLAAKGS